MGLEEPDLYRDTWVRYLGEHREPVPGTDTERSPREPRADTGKWVPASGTDIER